jgi:hypothetical protein
MRRLEPGAVVGFLRGAEIEPMELILGAMGPRDQPAS